MEIPDLRAGRQITGWAAVGDHCRSWDCKVWGLLGPGPARVAGCANGGESSD
jgi:hypothetical protein